MSRIIINASDTNQLSDKVKQVCDEFWAETLGKFNITTSEQTNYELQAVEYEHTIFDHHELLFQSHRHKAPKLKVQTANNEPLIQPPTLSDKFLMTIGQRQQQNSYFKLYRDKLAKLKQCLKSNSVWNKAHKKQFKQQQQKLAIIEQLTQRALLNKAVCQIEQLLRQSIEEVNQKKHADIVWKELPTMDFLHKHDDGKEDFSKKDVLNKIREIQQLRKDRIQLIKHNHHIGKQDKQTLIYRIKKSHRLTKLWLDSLEPYSSRYSRGWLSRIRHFSRGSLGLIGFLGLLGIIVAAVLMTNPGGIVAVSTVIAATIAFKLIGAITAITGLISFASLLSEVAANKLYYKQNPTKEQVAAIWINALFVTVGMGVQFLHSSIMWLVQNLAKVFMQANGVSNNIAETTQAMSTLSAQLSSEDQDEHKSHIFVLNALGGPGKHKAADLNAGLLHGDNTDADEILDLTSSSSSDSLHGDSFSTVIGVQ